MNNCRICKSTHLIPLYKANGLPLFQKKFYYSPEEAMSQKTTDIDLVQCANCGFVFNSVFTSDIMEYDENYYVDQSCSKTFMKHLDSVIEYLKEKGFRNKNIVEIGCGTGYFIEYLKENGFENILGFDPSYSGNNQNIIKDYFGEKYKSVKADMVLLRHVLEHIENPFEFLEFIKNASPDHTKIFIEVPNFDWIVDNMAFWNVYYEHCNYFDKEFLSSFFINCEIKEAFDGQYLMLLADLHTLKQPISNKKYTTGIFDRSLDKIVKFLNSGKDTIVWGVGANCLTILNLFDKDMKFIRFCIDINPALKDKYIPTSGHKIYTPDILQTIKSHKSKKLQIVVMNQNYYQEIVGSYNNKNIEFVSLEKLIR